MEHARASARLCSLLYFRPGTISRFPRDVIGLGQIRVGNLQCGAKQMTHLESESVMSDVCLGVAITGIYTLVGMGLVLVFM